MARDAGWQLDWRTVQGTSNAAACRAAAEHLDFNPLHAMFDQIVATPSVTAQDDARAAAERARLSFSTPVRAHAPGQKLRGSSP